MAGSVPSMVRALVLNVTYEPLAVVEGRRAAVLVLTDKADAVEGSGSWLHSERQALEVPTVIRLHQMVHVRRDRRVPISRRGVFARDGHRCQYCGALAETLDHVIPRSRGGLHCWENVVAACRPCNVSKADRTLEELALRLRSEPREPRRSGWVALVNPTVPEAWVRWLPGAVMSA